MNHPMNRQVRPVNQPAPVADDKTVYRFNAQSLAALKAMLPQPGVSATTTELQAGFLLGVQHVIAKLESGFTI